MKAFSAKRDQAVADEFLAGHSPCRVCNGSTSHDELSVFGAQCKACFDHYCSLVGSHRPPPRTRQQRESVLRALAGTGGITSGHAATVARRLRALEAAGMHLTAGQRWVLSRCEIKAGMTQEAEA